MSTLPPALCTSTSSPGNSSAYKCNSLSLESTQEEEFLDILKELKKHEPYISDIEQPVRGMNDCKGILAQILSLN